MPSQRIHRVRTAASFALATLMSFIAASPAPAQHSAKHVLWRVSSDSNTIYLLGSVHVLSKDRYPLDTVIENAYAQAKTLVLEVNLDSVDQGNVMQLMMTRGLLPDGASLRKVMSKKTYRLAAQRLQKAGLSIAMFDRFKPWVVGLMLIGGDLNTGGYEASLGVDNYFHDRAGKDGKSVEGLETVDFQFSLFDNMSYKDQEAFVRQSLDQSGDASSVFEALIDAWAKGDTAKLGLLSRKSLGGGEFERRLVQERNASWMPRIEAMLHEHNEYIVVVGALHLIGREGVVELLRAKGYQVEQL
jgi:uncharacterized protein YbaP (TraB family)